MPSTSSSILFLPLEIRLQIYQALAFEVEFRPQILNYESCQPLYQSGSQILGVCRQIRAEARSTFYQHTTLVISTMFADRLAALSVGHAAGEPILYQCEADLSLITQLRLVCDWRDFFTWNFEFGSPLARTKDEPSLFGWKNSNLLELRPTMDHLAICVEYMIRQLPGLHTLHMESSTPHDTFVLSRDFLRCVSQVVVGFPCLTRLTFGGDFFAGVFKSEGGAESHRVVLCVESMIKNPLSRERRILVRLQDESEPTLSGIHPVYIRGPAQRLQELVKLPIISLLAAAPLLATAQYGARENYLRARDLYERELDDLYKRDFEDSIYAHDAEPEPEPAHVWERAILEGRVKGSLGKPESAGESGGKSGGKTHARACANIGCFNDAACVDKGCQYCSTTGSCVE